MGEGSEFLNGRRKILLVTVGLMLAVLAFAWIDGGEEPLRPIAEPVPLPEQAQ